MNGKPFVWNADRRACYKTAFPWRVTAGRPGHITDYIFSFLTFDEALKFANGYASGQAA